MTVGLSVEVSELEVLAADGASVTIDRTEVATGFAAWNFRENSSERSARTALDRHAFGVLRT